MEPRTFLLIFVSGWMLISFFLYWPLFFKAAGAGKSGKILILRVYGFILFGLIPLVFVNAFKMVDIKDVGLAFDFSDSTVLWFISLALGLLIVLINSFVSGRASNLKEFPQIKDKEWTYRVFILNIITWILYLTAYEFLFRGLLLFPFIEIVGFWPAATLVTVVYSLSHYPKSLTEALGAIPFGLLLGWLSWRTGSIIPAIFIHSCLAVSNSIFSMQRHPEIRMVNNTRS